MTIAHVRAGLICLLCVLGLTAYSWFCQDSLATQVPLPTSPSSPNPGFCCQLEATDCAGLGGSDCITSSKFCGPPYNVTCQSEKLILVNSWGTCHYVDTTGNSKCQSFNPFWCAETQGFPLPNCAGTGLCAIFYGMQGACNPRDTINNTICNP
jgi:hypothetical protein